jgi:hypothetical protein
MATANETASKESVKMITISLPATMAAKTEALAESEGRMLSELFLEAFVPIPQPPSTGGGRNCKSMRRRVIRTAIPKKISSTCAATRRTTCF